MITLLSFIQCFINFFISYLFSEVFFSKRHKMIAFDFLVIGVGALLLSYVNSFLWPLLNTISTFLIMIVILCTMFKGKFYQLSFAGIIMVVVIIGCEFVPVAIISLFSNVSLTEVASKTIQQVSFSFISSGVFFIVMLLSRFAFEQFETLQIPHKSRINIALLPLPILSVLIAYFFAQVSLVSKLTGSLILQSITIMIGLVIVNVIVFASDNVLYKRHEYEQEIAEMHAQGQMKEALILQQDMNFQEVNSIVHDFKHQLLILQALIQEAPSQENQKKISQSITQTFQDLPQHELYISISCNTLRCILVNTHNQCKTLGIEFDTQIEFSDFDFMSHQDICTIFSNAFENAVSAGKEMLKHNLSASILLQIKKTNALISVAIRNDKINTIIERNSQIFTTKPDSKHHGFGLANIKRAVEKYGGVFKTDHSAKHFSISFIIPYSPT